MGVIYVDSLFFLNFLLDYLLCLCAARVCGAYLRRRRYLAAAAVGAAYAVAAYLPGCSFLLLPAAKLSAGVMMGLIAFGCESSPLRCSLVLLCVSAAFGGAVWAVVCAVGEDGRLSALRVLVLSFALGCAAFRLLFDRRAKTAARKRLRVRLAFLGQSAEFFALADTGNELHDPVTGAAIMTVSCGVLEGLHVAEAGLFERDAVSVIENLPDGLREKFRLVAYRSVGDGGLLPVFRPDALVIDGRERTDVLVAVAPHRLGEDHDAVF